MNPANLSRFFFLSFPFFPSFPAMANLSLVSIDLEDAQALAQNLSEHLQYDIGDDAEFWGAILERLTVAIRHAESF
jgi:hypothetical protein